MIGLDRPLPLTVDPAGDLVVGDYATGVVYAALCGRIAETGALRNGHQVAKLAMMAGPMPGTRSRSSMES